MWVAITLSGLALVASLASAGLSLMVLAYISHLDQKLCGRTNKSKP